jgi:hypothetical protein
MRIFFPSDGSFLIHKHSTHSHSHTLSIRILSTWSLFGDHRFAAPACDSSGFASFENLNFSHGNLTAVGLTESGDIAARHEIMTAGAPVAVVLSLDVPSAATGTGSSLVLDGHDCALVRTVQFNYVLR